MVTRINDNRSDKLKKSEKIVNNNTKNRAILPKITSHFFRR